MKRLICICLSLILVMSCAAFIFADEMTLLDPISGEIVDKNGNSAGTVRLSATCRYDTIDKMYVYTTSSTSNTDVACSVYNGMITTGSVVLRPGSSSNIEVYRSGQLLDPSEYSELTKPGSYVVNNGLDSSELFAFTIVPFNTNAVSQYKVPAIFYIASAKYNNEVIAAKGNTIIFDKDGVYHIDYAGTATNVKYSLDLKVDLTYPQLEIFGVDEDGIARGPVTFGNVEPDSTLTVTVDGVVVKPLDGEYTQAGQYVVKYADKAGNVSTYYFKMNLFFNISAIAFLSLIGAVLLLAGGYTIYTRKNRRVR